MGRTPQQTGNGPIGASRAGGESKPTSRLAAIFSECSGACGDLGSVLPYILGVVLIAGVSPLAILLSFGFFLITTGLVFRVPIAVQPMKAISALLIAGEISAAESVASGIIVAVCLIVLALTGGIDFLGRVIPRSVIMGVQAGLGLAIAWWGVRLVWPHPEFAALALLSFIVAIRLDRVVLLPFWLIGLGFLLPDESGRLAAMAGEAAMEWHIAITWPSWLDFFGALEAGLILQLPLTITNAVLITAILAHELYPSRAGSVSWRRLALSTGIGNLIFASFGALPMCHGAGGLQAQHRFGARTGAAPIILGVALLALVLIAGDATIGWLSMVPLHALGASLVYAGVRLVALDRIVATRPSCWPVIAVTVVLFLWVNPAFGLVVATLLEWGRRLMLGRMGE